MQINKIHLMKKSNDGESLEQLNNEIIRLIVEHYHGANVSECLGFYTNNDGVVQCEPNVVVEVATNETDYLKKIAKDYKRTAKQECVFLVLDGDALLI